ncbi:unnamed protein product [Orchesella dallaii]|uniref:EGF-like domain-containing protein n=1 Tax=Orchesella dallaii TaxID=48710 RepID=A0ABP1S4B0_9HEXA
MKEKNCLSSIFALLTFFYVMAVTHARVTYGQDCSPTNRCDSRSSLTCNNGTCECILETVMTFDGRKCAVFAGEKCSFTAVDTQGRGEERSWREELPCVENSVCKEGFCTCHPKFYESSNGTCLQKGGYFENCEFDLACKTDQFLICNESKKCGCNSSQSIYDYPRQLCVAVDGASCQNGQQCVSRATCIPDGIGENVCKCDSAHFANPEGKCETKRGYQGPCINDNQCLHGHRTQDLQLICNPSGFCDCRANISTYDSSRSLCVRLAGEECTDFPNCVHHSSCVSVSNGQGKKCKCNHDSYQTLTGTCETKRGHGELCQTDDHCRNELKLKCGLNGLCECELTKKVYDPSRRKCVGLVDSFCSYNEPECVTNAECPGRYSGRDSNCKCPDRFRKSGNGSCLAPHGSSCGLHWTSACDESQGIICKQGVCVCRYENYQTIEELPNNQLKCVSNVPGPCDENIPCVANAHCSQEEETFRQCVCNSGFVLVDSQCMLAYGEACDYSHNQRHSDNMNSPGKTCDKAAPLKCIKGTCQCEPLEEYDFEVTKCRGLVGSKCHGKKEDYCTSNAKCVGGRARVLNSDYYGTCKCQDGWLTTRNKRCILEINLHEENQNGLIKERQEYFNSASSTENPII